MDRPSSELVNTASVIRAALHCEEFVMRLIGQLNKKENEVFAVRRDVYAALIRRYLPTFRDSLSVPCSWGMQFGLLDP
jgi:hypothetical protein